MSTPDAPGAGASERNLAHYLAFRRHDHRGLQQRLADLGLSSLGRAEPHVLANVDKVLEVFGTMGIFAGLLFIVAGFLVGWLLGGSDAGSKRVMALGTSQRNIAAALVVAGQSFSDPKVVVMVIVVAILGMVTLMPFARKLGTR